MWSTIAARALVAALLATMALPAASPVSADAHRSGDVLMLTAAADEVFFSPDGDHNHDRAPIRFTTTKPAYVSVLVRTHAGTIRGPIRLGLLAAGRHVWRWDGRDESGRRKANGDYIVSVRAVRADTKRYVLTTAIIRTRPDRGHLVVGRLTIYPRATIVDDRVQMVYQRERYDEYDAAFPEHAGAVLKLRGSLVVRDSDGKVVRRDLSKRYAPRFAWNGRIDGRPAPAGDYRARVRIIDEFGYVRVIDRTITVSDEQLVERMWSQTVPAAGVSKYPGPLDPTCPGCGEVCGPQDSARYWLGQSFRPCATVGNAATARAYYYADVPFPEAAVDSYRVSSTGGPTTPGSADRGRLSAGNVLGVDTPEGDGTTTTPWVAVDLLRYPFIPVDPTVNYRYLVTWDFSTSYPQSYDVASFTVDYRHYVPASAG